MSGIEATDEAVEAYNVFKLQNSRKADKYAAIIYRIKDEKIVIEAKQPMNPDNEDNWEAFVNYICPEDLEEAKAEPAYAVFDFQIMDDERLIQKILFISFVPDAGKVKLKMLYGATKESFKGALGSGLAFDIQANTRDALDFEVVKKTVLGK
mmetsp:Transcript_117091/g.164631  ORF Transcript_117091/g.164631 Transcript_117091/m.164631 type:complete len:152 (-) Transcript_117091:267-722(-)